MIRNTPVPVGTQPYDWDTKYRYQCVWYAYYRCGEKSLPYPCWYEGSGTSGYGAYTNAKEWLKCYRSPWVPYPVSQYPDYVPVENDIAVFDGECGHVQFFETDVSISEYSNGDPNSFRFKKFERKPNLLGFLHLPIDLPSPVARNTSVDQIQTTDINLRIRTKPSLEGDVVGHVQLGYYNVLDTKDADGYTWYKLSKDRWCANVSTKYLPASSTEIIRVIEDFVESLTSEVTTLQESNEAFAERMKEIHDLSEVE